MKSKEEKDLEKEFRILVKKYNKILGSNGTWGDVLGKLGKKLYGKKFCGIYDQKNMPWGKIKKSKCLYGILNNDYEGPGIHWLAFYVKDKQFYVWDSYGRSMKEIVPVLEKKLKSQRIRYQSNDRDRNQTDTQKDCGSRCFAWLEIVHNLGIRKAMKV